MPKSRNDSKFLSRQYTDALPARITYKNTVIWRWLQFVVAGDDEVGEIVRALRKRVDMTNEWPNRSMMVSYILRGKTKFATGAVDRCAIHLWNLYAQFRDAEKRNTGFEPVTRNATRNPWREEPNEGEVIIENDSKKFLSR